MFSLPVTPWLLTASKAIAAFCMVLLSALCAFVSIMILALLRGDIKWYDFNVFLGGSDVHARIIISIIVALIMIFQQICLVYLAITISRLLQGFRSIVGFAIYCVILFFVELPVFKAIGPHWFYDNYLTEMTLFGLAALAFAVVFLWITGLLLKRRFNLE
jgi:hypothetical protein